VGPVATKVRPFRPRLSQETTDSGLPDLFADSGWITPWSVAVSRGAKIWLAPAKNPFTRIPLHTPHRSSAKTTPPRSRACRRRRCRPSHRVRRWNNFRRERATMRISAATAIVTGITVSHTAAEIRCPLPGGAQGVADHARYPTDHTLGYRASRQHRGQQRDDEEEDTGDQTGAGDPAREDPREGDFVRRRWRSGSHSATTIDPADEGVD
jgi:hypothetical protein